MTLYCIDQADRNSKTTDYLRHAAQERKIDFIVIDPEKFSYIRDIKARPFDLLYRVLTSRRAAHIEKFLTVENNFVTLRRDRLDIFSRYDNVFEASLIQKKNKLPIIKTVFNFTRNSQILSDYVKYLGGFPVVLKATGGSHGIGVMRIDSIESLVSVADVLIGNGKSYIMRQYMKNYDHARLIVLGKKVVASIEYIKDKNDFRTGNLSGARKFSSEVEDIAVKAVNVLNLEFGGVDILIDENGKPHIAEVNFPCYFPRAQETAGIDIAGQMMDYLIAKAKKTKSNSSS